MYVLSSATHINHVLVDRIITGGVVWLGEPDSHSYQ